MADPYFADDGTPDDKALAGLDRPSKLLAEWEARQDRLAAAKAGDDLAELRAAKLAVYNFRSYWRGVGETAGTRRAAAGQPAPAPAAASSKVSD